MTTFVRLIFAIKCDNTNEYYVVADKNITFYKDINIPEDMGLYHNEILTFKDGYNICHYVTKEEINKLLSNENFEALLAFQFNKINEKYKDNSKSNNDNIHAYMYDKTNAYYKEGQIEIDFGYSKTTKRGYVELTKENIIKIKPRVTNEKEFVIDNSKNRHSLHSINLIRNEKGDPANENPIKEN